MTAAELRNAGPAPRLYRPPAPIPHTERLGPIGLLRALRSNVAASWGVWHFEEMVVANRSILGETVVLNEPAAIRRVLIENWENYPKDALQKRVLDTGNAAGLLTAEGDDWRRVRRTLAPLFTPRATDAFAEAMRAKAEESAARLDAVPIGRTVDAAAEMTRVTFDILSSTLFSDGLVSGPDAFAHAVASYLNTIGRLDPLDAIGAPDWFPRLRWFTGRKATSFFEKEVDETIRRRREALSAGDAPQDLLTALIEARDPETGATLDDDEIGAHLMTFIVAGHETTSNALGWSLFLLAKHPDIRAAAEAEARTADAFTLAEWPDKLPLVRAVIEEAMRLYPPAATLTRSAREADRIGDISIPKGALVIIAPYVLHRHKKLWAHPELFRPERFLPGAREQIDRFQYLPFGAGPRICIGQRFAMLEAVIILATILRRVRLDWPERQAVMPVQRITLRPDPGLLMVRA